jgi:hypothetical protein
VDEPTKQRLLAAYEKRVQSFARQFRQSRWSSLHGVKPVSYLFMCRHYQICLQ